MPELHLLMLLFGTNLVKKNSVNKATYLMPINTFWWKGGADLMHILGENQNVKACFISNNPLKIICLS